MVELAELQEDVVQQLQSMEVAKMQMAEQKLAEQTRLDADLDVRLQAACSTLDCSAGDVATDLTDQHQHVLCSSVALGKAVYQILHNLYDRQCSNGALGVSKDFADNAANAILRLMLVYHVSAII